jgi:predicted site-specific integrase-resolvase
MPLTIKQVAAASGVSIDIVHGWIASGQLPAYDMSEHAKKNARWRIEEADYQTFKNRRRSTPPAPPAPKRTKRIHIPQIV